MWIPTLVTGTTVQNRARNGQTSQDLSCNKQTIHAPQTDRQTLLKQHMPQLLFRTLNQPIQPLTGRTTQDRKWKKSLYTVRTEKDQRCWTIRQSSKVTVLRSIGPQNLVNLMLDSTRLLWDCREHANLQVDRSTCQANSLPRRALLK